MASSSLEVSESVWGGDDDDDADADDDADDEGTIRKRHIL